MSTITILKVLEAQNPDLVADARDLIQARDIDSTTVRHIYEHTILIHKSGDSFRDCITFVSCILKLYSPESLIADCKVRKGVCGAMAKKMDTSQQVVSYYVKHARHYYLNLIAVRDMVDMVIGRFG